MKIRQPNVRALGLLAAIALTVALVGGCKKKEDQVVGKWAGPQNSSVTFNADKTFSQAGGPMIATGTWSLADDKVALKVEKINGKPAEEVINDLFAAGAKVNPQAATPKAKQEALKQLNSTAFTLSADGESLSFTPPGGTEIKLTKAAK